jgi:hypothetical protein
VKSLQLKNVWAIWSGPKAKYTIAKDGEAATANKLLTYAQAADLFHRLADGTWPINYSLAISLDAAECIAIDLYNAWDEARAAPIEGAMMWLSDCNTYGELCHQNGGERAIRIIARGKVPEGAVMPPRVKVTTNGFITLTTQRIPARPAWQVADDGGVIRDCTEALAHLLVPTRPHYVNM